MTIPAGNNWCPDCEEACHDHSTMCTVCGAPLVAPPPTTTTTTAVRLVPDSLSEHVRVTSGELRGLLQNLQSRIDAVHTAQDDLWEQLVVRERDVWQLIPAALWDPQPPTEPTSGNRQSTATAALAALPRTVLTAHSSFFHQCTLNFGVRVAAGRGGGDDDGTNGVPSTSTPPPIPESMIAVPGEFATTRQSAHTATATTSTTCGSSSEEGIGSALSPTVVASATLLVAEFTADGRELSESTRQAIHRAVHDDDDEPKPAPATSATAATRGVLLYVWRGGGRTFRHTARLAQEAGAAGCIVGNHVADPWPYTMRDSAGTAAKHGPPLRIPVVMASQHDGRRIQQFVQSCAKAAALTTTTITAQCTLSLQTTTHAAAPDCCVCTEVFTVGNSVLKLPQCGHVFHEDCAVTWLSQHNTCPYCRHELPLQDAEQERERRRRGNNHHNSTTAAPHHDFYG